MKIPSDKAVLESIFKNYKKDFEKFESRQNKIYVPIDCKLIAKELKTEPDIIFGRLYYHLEQKYGYKRTDGSNVHFFALAVGVDQKCVNFPLLCSVLAGLQEEARKHLSSQAIAFAALVVSILSLLVSLSNNA